MEIIARSNFTVTDLTDGVSITLLLTSSKGTMQVVSNESSYSPDWSATPNIITPKVLVGGQSTAQSLATAPVWKVGSTTVSSSTNGYEVLGASDGYALKITTNLSSPTTLITCEANYADTAGGVSTPITAQESLVKIDSASDGYAVLPIYTDGLLLDANTESVDVQAQLLKAGVVTQANQYTWYEFESGAWVVVNNPNTDKSILTITRSMVETKSQFKCEIKPTADYSGTNPSFVVIVDDIADDWSVLILGADTIKPNIASTTRVVKIEKRGVEVADYSEFTITWYKLNADGSKDESWTPKTGQTIEITRQDVTNRANFIVEVEK